MSVDGAEAGTADGRPERVKITIPPACDLTLGVVCTDKSHDEDQRFVTKSSSTYLLTEQG